MAVNLKHIAAVPTAKDFIDIVLSRTQRQTPTVVHRGYAISRIRSFYMRKVKFTQQVWHEKLAKILEEFPRVDDVHPFYADLMNVLYDKDHYKLALGQVNMARNLIDKIARDYVKLLKYGDSLYRCKQLKRAALGRMCTLMKKQAASLAYLEQVRQHLARLPSIDPSSRTLLVCGYPNVGKSSFMNAVTRAQVEVQPYAFTTRSLFVGHTDYNYLRWQVIDTPGILDRPLEERNTIEMQSITALAHLRCCVLYVVDISEQCGYSIAQQAALFDSIAPLFSNKPLVVAFNKTDARALDAVPPADMALLRGMAAAADAACGLAPHGGAAGGSTDAMLTMSTLTEAGVQNVKAACCDKLLSFRVDQKLRGKRATAALSRVYVAMPKPRPGAAGAAGRAPCIPAGVAQLRAARDTGAIPKRRTERDEQEEHGGAGVYRADICEPYRLAVAAWKHDIVPEILDGKNVFDFVDPDIEQRLAELEAEEDAQQAAAEAAGLVDDGADLDGEEVAELTAEEEALLARVRTRKATLIASHRRAKAVGDNAPVMPRTAITSRGLTTEAMEQGITGMGMDASRALARVRGRSHSRTPLKPVVGSKRARSTGGAAAVADGDAMQTDDGSTPPAKRLHSNRSRSLSRGPASVVRQEVTPGSGFKDKAQKAKAHKMADKAQRLGNKMARASESDRRILTKMPKHLFSGKRSNGKTDRR